MKKASIFVIMILSIVILFEGVIIGSLLYGKYDGNTETNVSNIAETSNDGENIDGMIKEYKRESEVLDMVFDNYMALRGIGKDELNDIISTVHNHVRVNVTFPQFEDYDSIKKFEQAYFDALDEADRLKHWNSYDNYSKVYHEYHTRFPDDNMEVAVTIVNYGDFAEYRKNVFRVVGEQNGRTFDDEYFEQFED